MIESTCQFKGEVVSIKDGEITLNGFTIEANTIF